MSWDVWLVDDRGHQEGSWNYTHNCNRMIAAAYEASGGDEVAECDGPLGPLIGPAWWEHLKDKPGPEGAAFLHRVITAMNADPDRYRVMNPENGWGDFDSLVKVLTDMRDAVPEWPTTWGVWA